MLNLFLFALFLQNVYCSYFDFLDIDDPALYWGHGQKELAQYRECVANTQTGTKYGVCIPHASCALSKGQSNGFCGLLSTCCVYERTCGKTTNAKVSYFQASDVSDLTSCKYTIKLRNPNVCQIRLDFVTFNLAPATRVQSQSQTTTYYKCVNDRLSITPNDYDIPDLCGQNDKQHVYVHVNQTDKVVKAVSLDVSLADRTLNTQLESASWRIKVTQLECPGYNHIKMPSSEAVQDFPLLAPLGALQYFTSKTGSFKSFGYYGTVAAQSYTYDQKYAIAFKREKDVCGIRFSPDYIYLPRDAVDPFTDSNCKHFLYVPDLLFEDTQQLLHTLVSKVCLTQSEVFRSYAPGPLFVHFNSLATDFTSTDETVQQGFNIKYELLSQCS